MTVSSLSLLPDMKTRPLPHSAVITVIGWISQDAAGHFFIGQIPLQDAPLQWRGKRVRATIYPPTSYPTLEILKGCRLAKVRDAHPHEKNQASFRIVGHLIRAERGLQSLMVEVYPQTKGLSRFRMQVRTTRAAIEQCDPSWTGVEVTGSLIDRMLLAEQITPAYAPVAGQWQQEKMKRLKRKKGKTAPKPPEATNEANQSLIEGQPFEAPHSWQVAAEEMRQEGPKTVEQWEEEQKRASASRVIN